MSNYLTGLSQLNPQVKRHNGGGTSLTLDSAGTTNATLLFVNGVAQTPGIDFNVSGATLTTTSTLPSGTNICTTIQYFSTGVVNTVADNAIGLGQMASGVDGNVISYDASGNPVAVATGNDGQVLTSTGAGSPPAFENAGGGAWSFISYATASSSATISFTGLDDTYDRYMATFRNLIPAVDNKAVWIRFGTGSTTYQTSGYQWLGQFLATNYLVLAANSANESDSKINGTGGIGEAGTASGETLHGQFFLADPADATSFTSIYGNIWGHTQSSSRLSRSNFSGGWATATPVTALQFLMSSGSIASGEFRLYGLNKS